MKAMTFIDHDFRKRKKSGFVIDDQPIFDIHAHSVLGCTV